MSDATREPPIQCFISYARADDTVMRFVEPFARQLAHFAFADRDRQVETFIDRDSITWGEEWLPRIRESLASAAVLMPIVTRQYFERQSCREELLTFHSEASNLGVQSLLLPVLVLGHSYISVDSPDVAAQIIAKRQFKDLREAWIEGPDSAIWRRAVVEVANDLVTVVEKAERTLSTTVAVSSSPVPDNRPGSIELGEAAERFGKGIGEIVKRIEVTMEQLTVVLTARNEAFTGVDVEQARQLVRDTASEIEPIGLAFEAQGVEMQQLVFDTDVVIRGYLAQLVEAGTAAEIEEARSELESIRGDFESLNEVQTICAAFLEQIRPLELASAPMRMALRPLRGGMLAITTAINLMARWPDVLGDGGL